MSQCFPALALQSQFRKYRVEKEFKARPYLLWGSLMAIGGFAVFSISPKPREVLMNADEATFLVLLRILPSIVGATVGMLGLMGAMLGLQALTSKKKPHPFTITEKSIAKGNRTLEWSAMKSIRASGGRDLALQIQPQRGSAWSIDCSLYENGEALRDAILAHRAETKTEVQSENEITGSTLETLLIPCTILGGMGLGMGILAIGNLALGWMPGRPDEGHSFGYMCAFFSLLLWVIVFASLYEVRVNAEGVLQAWLIGYKRQMPFSEVERIEIKTILHEGRETEYMVLKGPRAKLSFASKFWEYGEMRDRILSCVPERIVRRI